MVFHSAGFLFAILPVTLLIYHLIPWRRGKNALLIAASLLFYSFGNLRDLPLLVGCAVVHYLAGLLLLGAQRGKKPILTAVIVLDLVCLMGFKISGRLPLGISFFTFQAISYVVDLYRDPKNGSRRFCEVLQYLTFFPQLISGPLMKFSQAREAIENRNSSAADVAAGMKRFTVGLAKKLLLSACAAELADAVFALELSALDVRTAWLGATCYTLQIFFDFAGYSDMAIGLGRMFGYVLPENFNYPYCAGSVTEFWRRWHISLSAWFRDYLYIPLGGNRKGPVRTVCNKLIVFLATGLWHGTTVTFVLWGLWHGLWSAVETACKLTKKLEKRWYGHVYALLVVLVSFVLFRAESLDQAGAMLGAMFTGFSLTAASGAVFTHVVTARSLCFVVLACVLSLPVGPKLREKLSGTVAYDVLTAVATLGLLALSMLALASGSFQPFIYFQF